LRKSLIQWLVITVSVFAINLPVTHAEVENTKLYISGKYRFHFKYPSTYLLREGPTGAFVQLLMPKQRSLTFQVHNVRELIDFCSHGDPQPRQPCDTLLGVMMFHAKTLCAADGSDGTAYCLDEDIKRETAQIGGKTGYRFHLVQTEEDFQSHTKVKRAMPMILYYLDISSGSNQKIFQIYGTDDEINEGIINTLKFN